MDLASFPFETVDWSQIPGEEHAGEAGTATWHTRSFAGTRVRMVVYSPGYRADHWCEKGHFLLCLKGELETELGDGRTVTMREGMGYYVGDGAIAHRSSTREGATLYIVD